MRQSVWRGPAKDLPTESWLFVVYGQEVSDLDEPLKIAELALCVFILAYTFATGISLCLVK